jgi:hypothetical protein
VRRQARVGAHQLGGSDCGAGWIMGGTGEGECAVEKGFGGWKWRGRTERRWSPGCKRTVHEYRSTLAQHGRRSRPRGGCVKCVRVGPCSGHRRNSVFP